MYFRSQPVLYVPKFGVAENVYTILKICSISSFPPNASQQSKMLFVSLIWV